MRCVRIACVTGRSVSQRMKRIAGGSHVNIVVVSTKLLVPVETVVRDYARSSLIRNGTNATGRGQSLQHPAGEVRRQAKD